MVVEAKSRSFAIAWAQLEPILVSVIWNSRVSAVRGFKCIEVYRDTIWTLKYVHYITGIRR